ncbi:vWA domain-containing protein [Dethiosulfatarculus sandiegensis]|uniref:VWFA domain-containing protein n=1 Tax=Dethiosulfatarculus sandiegensis TaxID=1429043 RepID=A0A0D2HZM5_9BACT|nr:VWA domain-containing protein [Dethiosulfatarculus sandiegensis]KIX15738.1 hypothetical protein X474_02880 [Dethiosulfatarculus sandiegensis]
MKTHLCVFRIALKITLLAMLLFAPETSLAKTGAIPPYGALGLGGYRVASHLENSKGTLNYKDVSGREQSIKWYGVRWDLRTKYADNKARDAAIAKVLQETDKLGGEVLFADKQLVLARIIDQAHPNRTAWLELVKNRNKEIRLFLYVETRLAPGLSAEVGFDPARPDMPKELVFRADFDGRHYYTLDIEILEGRGVKVSAQNDLEDASPRIRYKTALDVDAGFYKKYGIYDLDPYRAPHIFTVKPIKAKKKTKVRITLRKSDYTIPQLGELSPKPGVFKLKNALADLPDLESKGYIGGSYQPTGDLLPDGDAIYWLNNGYYSFAINNLRTNLVPVLANHMTTVNWPLALSEMKPQKNGQRGAASRMAVYEVNPLGKDKAGVDISLSNLVKGLEPVKEDFSVFEAGGIAGQVESVERLSEPINLVILLDSSGSMKRTMKQALESVEAFIKLLPPDANITLVDFDTKVKPVKAKDRDQLIKKLRRIKANGATALYDSVIEAQKLLKGKSRASVVLFTDGKDANYNDTARGSKADFNQMMKSVQGTNLPIYPIAFGKKADTATLQAMARLTKTTYYQGESKEKLAAIFADIASNLSSAFRITFKRGERTTQGSQPVVNFMVDVSGSMDLRRTMKKDCEGCGYRFEQLKEMLAKSVQGLGDNTFMQLSTFSHELKTPQVITRDKSRMLAGIGKIKIGGGTDILGAVKRSLALSLVLPSSRRYLVFVTDAAGDAFNFTEDQKKELNANLMALKEAGVQCFWLGMWESPKVVKALGGLAKLSGGEAFVSSDANKIRDRVLALTEQIKKDKDGKKAVSNTVEVRFNRRDAKTGRLFAAVGHKKVDMPVLVSAEKNKIKDISYTIQPLDVDRKSYNQTAAASIYGDDLPLKEVRVKKIISLVNRDEKPVFAANRAMRMELSRAVLFDRLKGMGTARDRQFLVLDLDLANILPSQKVVVLDDGSNHPSGWLETNNDRLKTKKAIPTYRIPGLKNHLFIRVNNTHEIPFHPITWALEEPLTEIDSQTLDIPGGGHKKGVLAFDIPNENIKALSLHFYDKDYGHIDLPLIGVMEHGQKDLAALPAKAPAKLSQAFSLKVTAREARPELMGVKAPPDSVFEVLGLELVSRVNALLKLDPGKRFSLHIKTQKGDWVIAPHELSAQAPLGIYDSISLAPGSKNSFRLVFQVPEALKNAPMELVVELKGKDKRIALGKEAEKGPVKADTVLATGKAKGITLTINKVITTKRLDGRNRKRLLVDLTLKDKEDGSATRMRNFLALSNAPTQNFRGRSTKVMGNAAQKKGLGGFAGSKAATDNSRKFSFAGSESANRLLGCDGLVKDGDKRRCLLLFDPAKVDTKGDVYLISPIFNDLKCKVNPAKAPGLKKPDSYLMAKRLEVKGQAVDQKLKNLLAKVRQEKLNQAKLNRSVAKKIYSLEQEQEPARDVPPLPVSLSGGRVIGEIKDFDAAVKALAGVDWVPAYHERMIYSAEAVFTQGWGSEYDWLAFLTPYIRRKNVEVEAGYYPLTSAGKKELVQRAKGVPLRHKKALYLKWREKGEDRDIVLPFLKPSDELAGLLKTDKPKKISLPGSFNSDVTLTLYYEDAPAGKVTQMGSMGSALSGSSGKKGKKLKLLSKSYSSRHAANMPLDFWFALARDQRGNKVVRAYSSTPQGVKTTDSKIKNKIIPKKLVVKLSDLKGSPDPLTFKFKTGQKVEDVFLTVSFAAPDLPEKALAVLQAEQKRRLANIDKISGFSRLQWANRAKIYSFLGMQSRAEAGLKAGLKVSAARNKSPRIILAMMEKTPEGKLISSLDLCRAAADVYGNKNQVRAFKAGSGFVNAQAEAAVTPGAQSLMDQWFRVEGQKIAIIMPGKNKHMIKLLKERGTDSAIIARLKKSKNVWLYPLKNDGRPIWLEVDPKTYETVSMLPNGMHGAMTENKIIDTLIREGAQYAVGFFSGMGLSELTVAAVSLNVEDYDKVLERAEQIAGLIACGVSTVSAMKGLKDGMSDAEMVSGTIDIGLGMSGCINGDFARGAGLAKGMSYSLAGGDFKGDGVKSVLGFANGFGDAVTLYFKAAKETAHMR